MKWITREGPKIDRVACPWLIRNFVDRDAEFIYLPADTVKEQARKLNATPFDVPDVEFSHHDDKCTFDYILEKYKITDHALHTLAVIIRGADTDRHDIASQASGLLKLIPVHKIAKYLGLHPESLSRIRKSFIS